MIRNSALFWTTVYSCHQTRPNLTGRRGCWLLEQFFEDTVESTLERHLIHLSLREPPEPVPNKELGESGDGDGERGEGEVKGEKPKKGRMKEVKRKWKGERKMWRQPRGGEVGVGRGNVKDGGWTWSTCQLQALSLYFSSQKAFYLQTWQGDLLCSDSGTNQLSISGITHLWP